MVDLQLINPGLLEVYYGPMKSGKGEAIISRLKPLLPISNTVTNNLVELHQFIAFKPSCDDRDPGIIHSRAHIGMYVPARSICTDAPEKALEYITDYHKIIIFDETQFFGKNIVNVVEQLLYKDKNVIVAGLNLDFRGVGFGYMPELIKMAEGYGYSKELFANCDYTEKNAFGDILYRCPSKASRTQRLIDGKPANYDDDILVTGDAQGVTRKTVSYEARCIEHHFVDKN